MDCGSNSLGVRNNPLTRVIGPKIGLMETQALRLKIQSLVLIMSHSGKSILATKAQKHEEFTKGNVVVANPL